MGRHQPTDYSAEKFAEEVMGTATEQTVKWYEREIAWRERLVAQYSQEIDVLIEQRDRFARPEAQTGENPKVDFKDDPAKTQEFDLDNPPEPGE